MFLRHPDDEEPFHTGTWADTFATYADACEYYGVDTPAQLRAEAEAEAAAWDAGEMDRMEAASTLSEPWRWVEDRPGACSPAGDDNLPF